MWGIASDGSAWYRTGVTSHNIGGMCTFMCMCVFVHICVFCVYVCVVCFCVCMLGYIFGCDMSDWLIMFSTENMGRVITFLSIDFSDNIDSGSTYIICILIRVNVCVY